MYAIFKQECKWGSLLSAGFKIVYHFKDLQPVFHWWNHHIEMLYDSWMAVCLWMSSLHVAVYLQGLQPFYKKFIF